MILVSMFLQVSCGNRSRVKGDLGTVKADMTDAIVTDLTFLDIYDAVIDQNCKVCHGNYTEYDKIKEDKDKILEQILTNQMPQFSPGLSQDLKDLVEEWVLAGAPEFGNAE